jgi:hypothetical protein
MNALHSCAVIAEVIASIRQMSATIYAQKAALPSIRN